MLLMNHAATSATLTALTPGASYYIFVVATCTHDCLTANSLALGLGPPSGALSTQQEEEEAAVAEFGDFHDVNYITRLFI